MDLLYLAYYSSLFVTPLIFFLVVVRKRRNSSYSRPTWYYSFKKLFSTPSVKRFQEDWKYTINRLSELDQELPQKNPTKYESDNYIIYGADSDGNYLSIVLNFKHTLHMDVSIEFRSKCGKIYKLPNEPLIECHSTNSRCWKAAGLNIEILNPLRRLRITYNGIMRCSSFKTTKAELEFVNFRFFWNAGSEPIYYPHNYSVDLLTDTLAREPWRDGEWIRMLGNDCGFEQYGVLQGHLSATSFEDDLFLYLPSWRKRTWGPSDCLALKRDFHVFGVANDGTLFCVGAKSFRIGATQLRYGTVLLSNGKVKSISSNDVSLEHLGDNMEIPNVFTIHFKANGKTFKCVSHVNINKTSISVNDEEKGWLAKITNVECDLNAEQAKGFCRFWYRQKGKGYPLPPQLLSPQPTENPQSVLVSSLTSPEALDASLTGGKGNSLALLSTIISSEFSIPPGFIVTTTSFKKHLDENPQLKESISRLQDVCCGVVEGNPEDACKSTVDLFKSTPLNDPLIKMIEEEINALKQEFKDKDSKEWSWAVRSSGIGEDSDELSAAGQNSTFLGCKTSEDVVKAVAGCWGSLFTYQSVEYRRQHGLDIKSDIAVVIQKMIPSDCAGVLFTSHPSTGDPSQMIITSNYGLGESVVSASSDPDTITLAKSIKGNVKILASNVGSKKTQITLGIDRDTEEKTVDEELAKELSLNEQQAIKLGKVGVFLEKSFGNPRDIEWAFYKGELYILQSRPITTLNIWTDWELQHELDTPVMSKENLYTRANVGEVIKGAVSPLTQSITLQVTDLMMQKEAHKEEYSDYHRKGLAIRSHFVFLDVINFLYNNVKRKVTMENTVTDLAIFGHKVLDDNILKVALKRHGSMKLKKTLQMILEQLEKIMNNKYALENAIKLHDIWRIKLKHSDSPKAIMDKINFNLQTLEVATNYHLQTTRTSVIYQMIAMIILAGKNDEFNNDHYHDISLLLATNSGVESGEIPIILEGIADEVRKQGLAEEFIKIKPEDGLCWFGEKMPRCKEKLDKFLKAHGHRAFREFELYEETWDMKPETVVSMIQSNCMSETTTKKAATLSVDETIGGLISPKNNITRRILKFLVKKCRVAVAARETTKSVFIKTIHKFRLVFNELGKTMVKESLIPNRDLVFFFTIEELRDHLKERNPILVSKAIRRKKLYEKWNTFHFPELSYGIPIPEQEQTVNLNFTSKSDVKVNGTPVCKGHVVGRACVITDIKEINLIQSGDILITFSTDIAWSPYFPILSGVVTEIGGLISHGAVVAREYGLPCIVGAQHATKYFKTGDKVLLDGKTGIIQLVE